MHQSEWHQSELALTSRNLEGVCAVGEQPVRLAELVTEAIHFGDQRVTLGPGFIPLSPQTGGDALGVGAFACVG